MTILMNICILCSELILINIQYLIPDGGFGSAQPPGGIFFSGGFGFTQLQDYISFSGGFGFAQPPGGKLCTFILI